MFMRALRYTGFVRHHGDVEEVKAAAAGYIADMKLADAVGEVFDAVLEAGPVSGYVCEDPFL